MTEAAESLPPLDNVMFPNYNTMEEAFSTQFPPDIIAKALTIMAKWLRYAGSTTRKRPLFIIVDRNKSTGYPDSSVLEQEIEDSGFTRAAEVFGGEVIVFVNREARTVLCLHSALSIAADARNVVTVEQAVLRSQAAEFMARLARRATRRDADHDYRALESAARCEWVRKFTHMGSLHSAVIARHTFTPDTINAIRESNLPNALEGIGIGQRARKSDADPARALGNKSSRSNDNDVIVRALVLLSHASNEEEFDSAVVSIHEMFLVGVDPQTRSSRWNLLTKNWLVSESNTLERVLQKKKTLMKTSGDANARKPTDDEVMKNNLTISDLFKLAVGSCFWILDYGTNNTIPARTPPTIQSPNPNHNGASYPVFRLNYKVVTSRIRKAGKERVYDVKCPGDRPPLGWNIRIVGNSIETSRVVVGGSRYVLCAVIRKVPSTKAKSNK